YQLLKHPEVTPSTETCHKLAECFGVDPLFVFEIVGHVSAKQSNENSPDIEVALQRSDLKQLLLSAQDLAPAEIKLVQQLVDQLRPKVQVEAEPTVAQGAAIALVVEDTPDIRNLSVEMLRMAGLKVLEATDGQNALELIETSGDLIDIVLMDYRMPRMDGVQATQEIHKRYPDLPVLFVSAWDDPDMKDTAFEAGAAEYLVAPVEYDKLVDTILRIRQEYKN
ncbi:MAG: response regulator, partial [Chloroflexota bacterium]